MDNSTNYGQMLDIAAAARYLNVSEAWLRDHVTRKLPTVPHVRMGGIVRFRVADLDHFLQANTHTRPPGRLRGKSEVA